jgi:hypothetical protein
MSPVAVVALDEADGVVDGTALIGRVVGAAEAATMLGADDECADAICAVLDPAKKPSITRAEGTANRNAGLRKSTTSF